MGNTYEAVPVAKIKYEKRNLVGVWMVASKTYFKGLISAVLKINLKIKLPVQNFQLFDLGCSNPVLIEDIPHRILN